MTGLRPATMRNFPLSGNSADIFDAAGGRSQFIMFVPPTDNAFGYARPVALVAELLEGTTADVSLLVGLDSNGDGIPQAGEVLCETVFGSSPGRCILPITQSQPVPFWIMAAAPNGTNSAYTARLSVGAPGLLISQLSSSGNGSAGETELVAPSAVAAGEAFAISMTQTSALEPPHRYYGAIVMGGSDVVGTFCCAGNIDALIPFAIEEAPAHPLLIDPASGPVLVTPTQTQLPAFQLFPGESLRRLFFDLPPSASAYDSIRISVTALGSPDTPAPDLALALVRSDFPAPSSSAIVAPAPFDGDAAVRWNVTTAHEEVSAVLPHPQSGRWSIVATNEGSDTTAFVVSISDATNPARAASGFGRGANPAIEPGMYFNPQRGGHGISISRGADQQLLLWYTYREDGTPTWYIAQAQAPAADTGWWVAPLYRVTWDGSKGTPAQVGYVELAPTATNRFTYTWELDGEFGSEAFELLAAADSCVGIGSGTASLSGNWFAPEQAGYGVDVIARPDQQFDIFYFYDDAGTARWGIGSNRPFAANSTLNMLQSSGFCPTCTWTPLWTQALGTLTMSYASATNGTLAANFALKPPLSGTWNVNRPMLRLTGTPACR